MKDGWKEILNEQERPMKNDTKLSGVNKKCASCTKDCKQYKQVTIVYCPNYKAKAQTEEKRI